MNKQIEELKSHLDTMIGNSSQLKAEKLVKLGYRRQSELLIKDFKSNNSEVMRNKQIEEMAKVLTKYEYSLCERLPKDKCLLTSAIHAQVSCDYCKIAEHLYNAGYRKQSEVIDEFVKRLLDAFPENNRGNRCPAIYYDDYRYIIEELAEKMKGGAE